jgi:GNAT superfamily N-acetyltransferase
VRSVQPRYIPLPYQDAPDSGRLILRDGSTATVRTTRPDDKEALTAFFGSLSDESKIQRFFSQSVPSAKLIELFCDSSNPRVTLSLIVTRLAEPPAHIIAAGTYMARNETTAEIALTVDDAFQGKGIGTLLLERLALLAAANGFRQFWAVTMLDNRAMLDVFRDSGFACRTKADGGYIEIDLSVIPSEASVARAELRDRVLTTTSLLPFFQPSSVAVIGASRNPANIGGRILNALTVRTIID